MSHPVHPSPFLRRVLLADALVSVGAGALMVLAARPLQGLLGLPAALLVRAGLALFPYAAYRVWLATRGMAPRAALWLPIALNLVEALDGLFRRFGARLGPTGLGDAFIALHIVTALLFAELESIALRRSCAIVAA